MVPIAGLSYDTVLAVYTVSAIDALTPVTCNDDAGNLQSRVTFQGTAGTTYHMQVGGFDGRTANLVLSVQCGVCPPANTPTSTLW